MKKVLKGVGYFIAGIISTVIAILTIIGFVGIVDPRFMSELYGAQAKVLRNFS